jgi:hypothetical protein
MPTPQREPRRWKLLITTLLLIVVACTAPPPTGGGGGPVTGSLGPDGGILEGPDGFALGVPQGNLSATLSVTLERTSHPNVPFGADITPWGRSYRMTASEDAFGTLPTGQFLVALPVPDGADSDHLAVATLSPSDDQLDVGEDRWLYSPGQYLGGEGLLVALNPTLTRAGDVFRLVSADRFASPVAASEPPATVGPQQGCTGWFSSFEVDAGTGVSAAKADFVQSELDQALTRFRSLGFEPWLLELAGTITTIWSTPPTIIATDCAAVRYRVHIRVGSPPLAGAYDPTRKKLTVIIGSAFTDNDIISTIHHELFHALQNAYLGLAETTDNDLVYFTEGSAVLAEALPTTTSVTTSDEYATPYVDAQLNAPNCAGCLEPYEAQDFWKYVADQHTFGFAPFMEAFLGQGSVTPTSVDQVLRGPFGTSFPERYQGWANQLTYDVEACSYHVDNVKNLVDLGSVGVAVEASGLPSARTLSLTELTSQVFKLVVNDTDPAETMQLALLLKDEFADTSSDEISVSVVEDLPSLCNVVSSSSFEVIDGDAAHRFQEDASQTSITYYILAKNGQIDSDADGELIVDGAPKINGTPSANPSGLIADNETDVTFTLPFRDVGENIAKIHGTFEFENSSDVFNLTWEHDEAFVSGFTDQASGSGTIEVAIFVYCSERGSNIVTATWQLEDELGFKGEKKSTTMNVSFGGCTALRDDRVQPMALKVGGNER